MPGRRPLTTLPFSVLRASWAEGLCSSVPPMSAASPQPGNSSFKFPWTETSEATRQDKPSLLSLISSGNLSQRWQADWHGWQVHLLSEGSNLKRLPALRFQLNEPWGREQCGVARGRGGAKEVHRSFYICHHPSMEPGQQHVLLELNAECWEVRCVWAGSPSPHTRPLHGLLTAGRARWGRGTCPRGPGRAGRAGHL